jgi:hypothetical protein
MTDTRLHAMLDMMKAAVSPGMNQETGREIVIGIIIVNETVTMNVETLGDPQGIAKDQ